MQYRIHQSCMKDNKPAGIVQKKAPINRGFYCPRIIPQAVYSPRLKVVG